MILGLDPGETSGWCLYDEVGRRAVGSGIFETYHIPPEIDGLIPPHAAGCDMGDDCSCSAADHIAVVERPKGYGKTFPQVVDCGYVCGRLVERIGRSMAVEELLRVDVRKALSVATHGTIVAINDATTWQAILQLHGGEQAAKKGGPLHGVRSHARAALACAVAYSLLHPMPHADSIPAP